MKLFFGSSLLKGKNSADGERLNSSRSLFNKQSALEIMGKTDQQCNLLDHPLWLHFHYWKLKITFPCNMVSCIVHFKVFMNSYEFRWHIHELKWHLFSIKLWMTLILDILWPTWKVQEGQGQIHHENDIIMQPGLLEDRSFLSSHVWKLGEFPEDLVSDRVGDGYC